MKDYIINPEGEDPLKVARLFSQSIQSLIVNCDEMAARLEQSELRIKELEQENERLLCEQQKNDLWSSRVTYENVVELIASYEDASQRDEARKLIEPLLKNILPTAWRRALVSLTNGRCFRGSGTSRTWPSWLALGGRRASCRPGPMK